MVNISTSMPIKKRESRAQLATLILALFFTFIGAVLTYKIENDKFYTLYLCVNIAISLATVMMAEVFLRACLIIEELFHIPSRYGQIKDVLSNAFTFSKQFMIVLILLVFLFFGIGLTYGNPIKLTSGFGWQFSSHIVGALLLNSLLKPKYGPLYQAINIGNINGLDYGSAMAYSFYHGYLQIILPNKGDEQKGIRELMNDFAAKHGVEFQYDKLLVLIPLSLHCCSNLEDRSKIIELAQSLNEITINRAGVSKRSYKSTAYKIRAREKRIYVCVEYATPLQTLYEIISHRNEHAQSYEIQRKELVLQFYLTLKSILDNDPDCRDCCDIIFYDDKKENGEFVDVGEVVLDHLTNYTLPPLLY